MKWLLPFVFNLAAIVCALRAASLIFSVQRIYLPRNGAQSTWEMSEAAGFMSVGCICASEAFRARNVQPSRASMFRDRGGIPYENN
jgi:hypothetical protein